MNTVTLGTLPVLDPPPDLPGDVNFLEVTGHLERRFPNRGQFLMLRSDFNALNANRDTAGSSGPPRVKLVMKGNPGPGLDLEVQVYVLGATPVSLEVAKEPGASENDVVLVHVVFGSAAGAYYTDGSSAPTKRKAYNVQVPGYFYDGNDLPAFCLDSLNAGSPWTWTTMLTELALGAGGLADRVPTTWQPRNLDFSHLTPGEIIDYLCNQLYLIPGFTYTASGGPVAAVYNPGESAAANTELEAKAVAASALISGGPSDRAPHRFPKQIRVIFPRVTRSFAPYLSDFTGETSAHRDYTDPLADMNDVGFDVIFAPHFVKVPKVRFSGTKTDYEQTLFDAVGDDLAARRLAWLKARPAFKEYAGIWRFACDGLIRRVRWVSNAKGAVTRVWQNELRPAGGGGGLGPNPDDGLPMPLFGTPYPGPRSMGHGPMIMPDTGNGMWLHGSQFSPIVTVLVSSDLASAPGGVAGIGGAYNGTIVVPGRAGAEDADQIGVGGGIVCIVLNAEETIAGSGTVVNWLAGSYTAAVPGVVTGYTNDSPPKPIVRILGGKYKQYSSQLLDSSKPDWTWERNTTADAGAKRYGNGGVAFEFIARVEAGASTGQLKVFTRRAEAEACGRITKVGAEVESTVTILTA